MPRQFSFRGDRLAYSWGIVLLAAVAFLLLWAFGGDTHALIPLYSVGVFVCFTLSQIRHGPPLAARPRERLALAGDGQRAGRRPDGRRPRRRRLGEVRRRRLSRRDPRPAARRDDAVHPPPVRPLEARAGDPRRTSSSAPPRREERVVIPIPGLNRCGRPGGQRRPLDRRRRPGRAHLRGSRGGRRGPGRLRAPDPGRPAGRRRVAVPGAESARCSPTSTCSTRPGRRTSPSRSRSWSSPSTSPAAGGSGSSTTSRPSASGRLLLGRPHTVVVAVPYRREDPELFDAAASRGAPGHRSRARSPTETRRWYRGRRSIARPPDGRPTPARPIDTEPMSEPISPAFRRAVVALNGGSSDARIVRLVAEHGRPHQGRADRRPRRRDRLDAAARRRHRRPIRGGPARAGHGRGDRRAGQAHARAGPAPGARRRGGASSTRRPNAAPTCSSPGCPTARGSAASSRSARPSPTSCRTRPCAVWVVREPDERGNPVKIVIVGCGRVGASARRGLGRAAATT